MKDEYNFFNQGIHQLGPIAREKVVASTLTSTAAYVASYSIFSAPSSGSLMGIGWAFMRFRKVNKEAHIHYNRYQTLLELYSDILPTFFDLETLNFNKRITVSKRCIS